MLFRGLLLALTVGGCLLAAAPVAAQGYHLVTDGPTWVNPQRQPRTVTADELSPLTFTRLIVRIAGEDEIGVGKEELRVHFLEELRRWGYPAVGAESLVFDKDRSAEAMFALGGTAVGLRCTTSSESQRICAVDVEWELMNQETERVVYRLRTRYQAHRHLGQEQTLARELLDGSFRSLLAHRNFEKALRKRTESPAVVQFRRVSFRACPQTGHAMPSQAEAVLRSVVVVETAGGHGSGTLISPDGLVLTAAHVVRSRDDLAVRDRDGISRPATVIRLDAEQDLALLRTTGDPPSSCLPIRTEAAGLGEEVYAIGAPLDPKLSFSLTRGIVSGIRDLKGRRLLQTDASVNAGNSGGPLVDSKGRLLAVVRAKLAGFGVEGVAFGIPSPTVLERLALEPGKITDPALSAAPPVTVSVATALVVDPPDELVEIPPAPRGLSPTGMLVLRIASGIVAGAGVVLIAGSYGELRSSRSMTKSRFESLRLYNDIGWVTALIGGGVLASTWIFDMEARPVAAPSVSLVVGPTSVGLSGSF